MGPDAPCYRGGALLLPPITCRHTRAIENVVVGFLLGILGSGFIAVLTVTIQARARDEQLKRALISELRENLMSVQRHRTRLQRTAWDDARSVRFDQETFRVLADTYLAVVSYIAQAEYNSAKFLASPTGMVPMGTGVASLDYDGVTAAITAALVALGERVEPPVRISSS